MMQVIRADERGKTRIGWLDSKHTFSFGSYYNPNAMGFSTLRVINDDRVAPGQGFGTHPHRDMEIISYVVEGQLEHKDSMGTGSVIEPGDVQIMSAGTGVTHSEFNPSRENPVRFLQIWIPPAEQGAKPRYDQKRFDWTERRGKLRVLVSPDGEQDSLPIRQNARILGGLFDEGEEATFELPRGRNAWVQVVKGKLEVNGVELTEGDGLAVAEEQALQFKGIADSEVLLFDLQ